MLVRSFSAKNRDLIGALKGAAEPTRLRILLLLSAGELNVKDLTQVLGQSQPRISRHLKLLAEAGLVERFQEGSWVYFRPSDRAPAAKFALDLLAGGVDGTDPVLCRDRERLGTLKREREAKAQAYFREHAADWARIRALHVSEEEVEARMRAVLGPGPFKLFLDLGTGTGRILELFADRYARGLGIDVSQSMLAYARGALDRAGLAHAQVRHGDIYDLGLGDGVANAVVMHQVLHFLSDPARALSEAARVLAPDGRLLIVDFAPHDLEFLRDRHAHERLGFSHDLVGQWLAGAGLAAIDAIDLSADQGGDQALTVSMWLATRGRVKRAGREKAKARTLEGTS